MMEWTNPPNEVIHPHLGRQRKTKRKSTVIARSNIVYF